MPGERVLAGRYAVSPETVRRAVRMLREERAIVVRRGIGNVVQPPPEPQTVRTGPGDVVLARLPDSGERERLGLPEGVWVLAVQRAAGGPEELYDANRARVIQEE